MMSVFSIPNFCTTSTRRSKSRNRQKVDFCTRSFTRSFWKSVGFSRILNKGRVTEVPRECGIRSTLSFFFKKVTRRNTRR